VERLSRLSLFLLQAVFLCLVLCLDLVGGAERVGGGFTQGVHLADLEGVLVEELVE